MSVFLKTVSVNTWRARIILQSKQKKAPLALFLFSSFSTSLDPSLRLSRRDCKAASRARKTTSQKVTKQCHLNNLYPCFVIQCTSFNIGSLRLKCSIKFTAPLREFVMTIINKCCNDILKDD